MLCGTGVGEIVGLLKIFRDDGILGLAKRHETSVKSELESFFSTDLYLNQCHGLC